MDIQITDDKTLGEVKTEFQQKFPHLKLEFYEHSHKEGEGSPERYLLEDTLTIGAARKTKTEGGISINANQKTNTLETRFKAHYGLNVQVFRKSGKLWMQTTSTDEWTLAHQEQVGENHDR